MDDIHDGRTADGSIRWLHRRVASFAVGLISGGVCNSAVHLLVYGDVDPSAARVAAVPGSLGFANWPRSRFYGCIVLQPRHSACTQDLLD